MLNLAWSSFLYPWWQTMRFWEQLNTFGDTYPFPFHLKNILSVHKKIVFFFFSCVFLFFKNFTMGNIKKTRFFLRPCQFCNVLTLVVEREDDKLTTPFCSSLMNDGIKVRNQYLPCLLSTVSTLHEFQIGYIS